MERTLRTSELEHAAGAAPATTSTGGTGLHWYWNRLRCMSVPEIAYRIRQKATGHAQRAGVGVARRVPPPDLSRVGAAWMGRDPAVDPAPYVDAAERLLAGRLRVFEIETVQFPLPQWNRDPRTGRLAPLSFGKHLNYRDESLVGDIKYLWEPNRHLHLVTLAQAHRLTGQVRYALEVRRLLGSWFEQCPYLRGPNWTSSLELGIRLINWSIVWQLIGGSSSAVFADEPGRQFRDAWLAAVYRHMHFIAGHFSRFSSANNHLIGEAAGLFVAATTWPCWPEARNWGRDARKTLVREALRQNAADGVNREQAIAYQQFVLDFLLIAGLAGRASGDDFSREYWARIERMLEFIAALIDVGGHVPMIGDADDGFVVSLSPAPGFCPYRSLLATGAALFGRNDFKRKAPVFDDKSRWLLGDEGARAHAALSTSSSRQRAFPEGGYWVLGRDLDTPAEIRLVVDAGSLGYERIAAHGHADALAFTLSLAGREFLVDPGTYAYHTRTDWRRYFRGTAAHNTIRVDGADQSVMGGSFMWLHHARARCLVWEPGSERDRFVGMHDGYTRLDDPVVHEREVVLDKSDAIVRVTDTLRCEGAHLAERCWHFAEDVDVELDVDGSVVAERDGIVVRLQPQETVDATLYRGSVSPIFGWISRRFGVKEPTSTVVWRSRIQGNTVLGAVLAVEHGAGS